MEGKPRFESGEQTVLRTFSDHGEADIALALLQSAGIEAFVVADDCGAVAPGFSFGRGVLLLVAEGDVAAAGAVLDAAEEATKDGV